MNINLKLYFLVCTVVFLLAGVFTFSYIKLSTKEIVPTPQVNEITPEVINVVTPKIQDTIEPTTEKMIPKINDNFIMPIKNGKITKKFSGTDLVFSKTLNEWQVHKGIDIEAPAGTPVISSNSGYVKSIEKTIENGISITLEHKGGYKTVYSNLSSDNMVKIGEEISKEQTISGIGRTATFESSEPDHLHFEMYKDNVLIDPMTVIN